jgi:hypothetical protein
MVFKFLNRRPSATSKANAVALSGLVTEAAAKNLRLEAELLRAQSALKNIIIAAGSVNAPNGTTRKLQRIAEQGLGR